MIEGSGSRSIPLTSGSGTQKHMDLVDPHSDPDPDIGVLLSCRSNTQPIPLSTVEFSDKSTEYLPLKEKGNLASYLCHGPIYK